MDDAFVVLHSEENTIFFRHNNAVDTYIQLTQVNISDNKLSFLHCLLTIDTDRILSMMVPRKYSHKDQYLNIQCSHPLHKKLGFH